jgi:hypothetical protein
MLFRTAILALLVTFSAAAPSQQPPAWHDDLVENIIGTWKVEGNVAGRTAHHVIKAEWVTGHQFVQLHEQTQPGAPANESRYDALWFLGYDSVSERYVMHLIDVFGGRFSETLGYATRDANELRFVFEYGDGPFHNTWRWLPESKTWEWHLEQKDKNNKWKPFADFKLTPVSV